MIVWIVFGDIPRSDGDNILGVYTSRSAALARAQFLKTYNRDVVYVIEPFEVEEEI